MGKRIFLIKIIIIFYFFLASIFFILTPLEPNSQYQWNMLIITAISTVSFFIIQKEQYKKFQWLSISTIFVLGYWVVFYQMIILHLMGYDVPDWFFEHIWADETVMNKSIGLSTLGLLSFFLGEIYAINNNPIERYLKEKGKISSNSIFLVLIFSYMFYIMFLLTSGSYIYGEYTPTDASGMSTYFFKLFEVSLSAAIIIKISYITSLEYEQLSFRKYLSYFGKPLLLLLFWHIAFSLFVGDRGPIIYFSLLAFGIYFLRWKQIDFFRTLVVVFLLSSFLTFIGQVRQSRFSGMGYLDRIVNIFSNYERGDQHSKGFDVRVPVSETLELAFSIDTLNHAIYNVPNKYDYMYGMFQFQNIVSIVPGLSGIVNSLLFGNEKEYSDSAAFITYLIQGKNPGYGNGTSIIADFYLDFGVYGVVIGMFLFGLFIGKNEYKLFFGYQKPTLAWIATLIFFGHSLYINRSTVGLQFANIVLIYVLIKMNAYFILHYKKKSQIMIQG